MSTRPSGDNGPFEDHFEVHSEDNESGPEAGANYLVLAAGSGRLDLTEESLHVHRMLIVPLLLHELTIVQSLISLPVRRTAVAYCRASRVIHSRLAQAA
jgi:hypothetical protein